MSPAPEDRGRRGAGVNRSGATDTTMLIWKTIDANPGLTRDEIFAKIEHKIPAGWAKRRYLAYRGEPDLGKIGLNQAWRYVFLHTLRRMRDQGSIAYDGDPTTGRYRILREIKFYEGNPDHVDETDTKAADHINRAYAERTLRATGERLARMYGDDIGAARLTKTETKAFMTLFAPRDNVPSSDS